MNFYTEILKGKNKRLILEEDKEVIILDFVQKKTYSGVHSGKPSKVKNKLIINSVKNQFNAYVIEPPKLKIPFFKINKRTLPAITCRVSVKYEGVIDNCDGSSLQIVWFQDDYAFPIDDAILKKMKKIPYTKVCNKYQYDY